MIFPELAKLMAFEKMRQKDLGDILGISQQSTALKLNGKTDFSRKPFQKKIPRHNHGPNIHRRSGNFFT
jgi:hypothetical protein